MTVLLFARYADLLGASRVEVPGAAAGDLDEAFPHQAVDKPAPDRYSNSVGARMHQPTLVTFPELKPTAPGLACRS